MNAGDLPDVERISAIVHPRYPESEAVPAERLRLFPAGCLIAASDGSTIGYAIAHPGLVGLPPALDTLLGALPDGANCLYFHDVALLPEARGLQLGAAVATIMAGVARRHSYAYIALTAVNNSANFWSRQGFAVAQTAEGLESYGGDAVYMVRAL